MIVSAVLCVGLKAGTVKEKEVFSRVEWMVIIVVVIVMLVLCYQVLQNQYFNPVSACEEQADRSQFDWIPRKNHCGYQQDMHVSRESMPFGEHSSAYKVSCGVCRGLGLDPKRVEHTYFASDDTKIAMHRYSGREGWPARSTFFKPNATGEPVWNERGCGPLTLDVDRSNSSSPPGSRVMQVTFAFKCESWHKDPESAGQMFALKMEYW